MKMRTLLNVLFAIIIIALSGCDNDKIKGNHDVKQETRKMVSFENVINKGSFNVYISNALVYEVVVEAESNIIPYIRTTVNGNSLIIDSKESISANYPINIYVKSPLVKSVEMEGSGLIQFDTLTSSDFEADIDGSGDISGKIIAKNVDISIDGSGNISIETNCKEMETEINGSGNINLVGFAEKCEHEIDGSGNINSLEFVVKNCEADISGSGNMNLNVTEQLDVKISGSGSVYYTGTAQVNVIITGSGSVIKL
jgi:carbon monoxide dehydrogenase subunit G